MRLRMLFTLLVLVTSAVVPGASAFAQRSGFPHTRHAKLFPNCAGCHEGIFTGVASRQLPAASACTTCHNGRDVREVAGNEVVDADDAVPAGEQRIA